MNLYRGLTGILFKNIDPFFKGSGEYNSYGEGTSYSPNKQTAHQYATNLFDNKQFGYLLSYTASNLNIQKITPENFVKQCDSEFMKTGYYKICIDGRELLSNELSSLYLNKFNALDINESHEITTGRQIFIIDNSVSLDLIECFLYLEFGVDKEFIEDILLIEGIAKVEDDLFRVPLSKIEEVDELISDWLI